MNLICCIYFNYIFISHVSGSFDTYFKEYGYNKILCYENPLKRRKAKQ